MPPKATTANNASANASTLNANGQPKRKRTRGRGGRGRGGRGKKAESSDESSSDSSSSSDEESSDDDEEPVASTSKIATGTSQAKSASALAVSANGKGKASASSEEDSDDDGNSSDSSSSSSSFLTTSDEEEDMPAPRNTRGQGTQGSAADGASTYSQQHSGTAGQEDSSRGKRPEMTKPNDPPYIQFGADADLAHNVRAFGKPILWGLLPGDVPSTSTSASVFDNDETDERSKAIIEAEKAKAEERYLKFRDDYVSKMISRFGGSLDVIRQKEADTMKESRLQVLIQSIAGGADTFTSRDGQGIWKTNEKRGEREVVLEGLDMQAVPPLIAGMDEDVANDPLATLGIGQRQGSDFSN
ncbi:hypothetical protein P389DRAFT_210347 [Cystobasidium minutum MCA 4210]|uniref:uncharacterized protein n=1 Tax=Cystobasidium minutum MCA 4210 TaxID=1397322 RepID=UPI0034CEE59C|eukprot:jgi/Rhomi1/210347/estExt_Genemark1.C_3_t30103